MLREQRLPAVDQTVNTDVFEPVNGARIKFSVNEEESIAEFSFGAVFSNSNAVGQTHLTMMLNGVDLAAPYVDGLVATGRSSADRPHDFSLHERMILQPGEYLVEVHWKTPSGTSTLRAVEWPATFTVELRSHPSTLGQGVNAKSQGSF